MAQATSQRIAVTPKCGVDTAFRPALAANGCQPGAVTLHGQALNSLSRCQRELLSPSTSFDAALAHLQAAQQAVTDLAAAVGSLTN